MIDERNRKTVEGKLGSRGWTRLLEFGLLNPQDAPQEGKKLATPDLVKTLCDFLERFSWPPNTMPSLFLTDRGGIELAWEEAGGAPVQVEFHRDGIELYREATGVETEFASDQVTTAACLLANGSRA